VSRSSDVTVGLTAQTSDVKLNTIYLDALVSFSPAQIFQSFFTFT
jgi:uncharacterized membrane protein